MIKKLVSLLLIVTFAIYFVGCGGSSASGEAEASVKFNVNVNFDVPKGECNKSELDDFVGKAKAFWDSVIDYATTIKNSLDSLGKIVAAERAKQKDSEEVEDDKTFSEKLLLL